MDMDKYNYPLTLAVEIETLLKYFREFTNEKSNLLELVDVNGSVVYVRYKKKPDFFFQIHSPRQSPASGPLFTVECLPKSQISLEKLVGSAGSKLAKSYFSNWHVILEGYESVKYREEDFFLEQYEEEFYADFELIDDDAETKPFEHQRQLFLYKFLDLIDARLDEEDASDEDIAEIKSDIAQLQSNIQNLTKKNATIKLSKIFAKAKKKGLKLISDIYDVGKKEIIKQALYKGYDGAINLLDLLT
jgi:hypothetical protein